MTHPSASARSRLVAAVCLACALTSCAPALQRTGKPDKHPLRQLWIEPSDIQSRDLFHGIGGTKYRPDPDASYAFLSADTSGFSHGYEVKDPSGVEWDVKVGPESQTEVVASRLLWAVGFHQRPMHYLPAWKLTGLPDKQWQAEKGGRFRPKLPGIDSKGDWSWHENPFVGTRPYRGLVVLNAMLGNSDLKTLNNGVAEVSEEWGGPSRWFFVKDLGHTFGRTGKLHGTRGDAEGFARHRFITGVRNGRVQFEWHGFHGELLDQITPADVRWAADALASLSQRQLVDAFRAGGYSAAQAAPFITTLNRRIKDGQRLTAG